MSFVSSFNYASNPSATALILGSMPGKASLQAMQYYAHPRNLFWVIMQRVLGIDPSWPYEKRLEILSQSTFALWDVMQSCYRESSLDSDIQESSIVPNNFELFFENHSHIQHILFNGSKAEAAFMRYVHPS